MEDEKENAGIDALKRRIDVLKENIKRSKEYKRVTNIELEQTNERLEKYKLSLKECERALTSLKNIEKAIKR